MLRALSRVMVLSLASVTLVACNRDSSSKATPPANDAAPAVATSAAPTAASAAHAAGAAPADGSFVYRGTIDREHVVVRWQEKSGALTGTYFYEPSIKSLTLKGTHASDGKIHLDETAAGKISGSFDGQMDTSGNVSGTWSDPKKTKSLAFALTAQRPSASGPVTLVERKAKWTKKAKHSEQAGLDDKCTVDVSWPEIVGAFDAATEEKWNKKLAGGPYDEGCDTGFESTQKYTVDVNQDGVLALDLDIEDYAAGAAHPNYGKQFVNIAVPSGAEIKLTDFLTAAGVKHVGDRVLSPFVDAGDDLALQTAREALTSGGPDFVLVPDGLNASVMNWLPHAMKGAGLDGAKVTAKELAPMAKAPTPVDALWKR